MKLTFSFEVDGHPAFVVVHRIHEGLIEKASPAVAGEALPMAIAAAMRDAAVQFLRAAAERGAVRASGDPLADIDRAFLRECSDQ